MSLDKERKRTVADAFNSSQIYFEMMLSWHQKSGGAALEPEVQSMIDAECEAGHLILDAGCGEGSVLSWFANRFPLTKFVGTDVSKLGIRMARRNTIYNALFQVADLTALPYQNDTFDFMYCQSVLEHVAGWEMALREFRRVLKTNGKMLLRVGNGGVHGKRIRKAFFDYVLHNTDVRSICPTFRLRPGNYDDHMKNFDVQEIPSDILLEQLRSIGFTIDYFTTRTHEFRAVERSWKAPLFFVVSWLNFWPFSHLGPVTIILATKVN